MGSACLQRIRFRIAWLSLVLAAIAGTSLFAYAGSARAGEPHPFTGISFGHNATETFSNPNGVAIDESTGDVYVADIGTQTVYKFDGSGNPVDFTEGAAAGTNALTGADTPATSFEFPNLSGNPAAVAVDNSREASDHSAGDLYVLDLGHEVIDKFASTGKYLGQVTGPFQYPLRGIGVGPDGDLHVDVNSQDSARLAVEIFDDSAVNRFVALDAEFGEDGEGGVQEFGFATGGQPGADYPLLSPCGCFAKVGSHGEQYGRVDAGATAVAAAVDPASGHLYVDDQSSLSNSVSEWDGGEMNGVPGRHNNETEQETTSTGTFVSGFELPALSGSSGQGGIAVDGASGDVYVSNPADGKVYVFGSDTPVPAAGTAANVTQTSATLQGTVNPRGLEVTSCQFEYAPNRSNNLTLPVGLLEGSAPCLTANGDPIGEGSSPVAVHADISGLEPGSLYHFRLAASDANGAVHSGGLFPTASAAFGIKQFEVLFLNQDGTPDVQAGSHPYKVINNIVFNTQVVPKQPNNLQYISLPAGNAKDIIVHLPPGFYGDPNATTKKCTLQELVPGGLNDICPPESEVGHLEAEINEVRTANVSGATGSRLLSIVPPPGVAFQLAAHILVPNAFIDFGVPAGGDSGVTAVSEGVPATVPLFRSTLTVFGIPPLDPVKPLLTMPSSCNGPLVSTISADSYQEPGHWATAQSETRNAAGQPAGMSGCAQLEFPPSITVAPDSTDASTSSGLTVGVHVSQKAALNLSGLGESGLRDTTVILPEGVALNPAGADGLEACSEGLAGFEGFAEFNKSEPGNKTATFNSTPLQELTPGVNLCPNGSKIGTVKLKTPLLEHELEGFVYLAAQNSNPFGSLVAMYMFFEDPFSGSAFKLTGEVKLTDTGQIVTTFKNTPDLPFEELQLHFFGGERAPLSTPSRCGTYTTRGIFTPWDGNGLVETSSSFQIEHGPHGTPCPGSTLPFEPSLTAGVASIQAGGFSPFTLTMSREDGQQNLQSIVLHMPPGLSGTLDGVKLCGEAEANAGTCGAESLIGETIVSVGVGGDPFSVKGGKVYITEKYKGAPFGLSIVNPAKAGPFDLGQVVVRAKIEVDPTTSALTVVTDPSGEHAIPHILDGIPLQIQHVSVTITRHDFTFNPTNCNPLAITGALSSVEGASGAVSLPFQVTNCATLGFKPQFSVSTPGKPSRTNGVGLDVKLSYPTAPFGSQANVAKVKVELPKQLPSRLTTLQKACPDAIFNANPASCPGASRVGEATATTPLVPVMLHGPAYFVSHGGAAFPELILVLSGYGITVYLHGETFISKSGITSSTFNTIPDVPIGTFELKLPAGPDSALAANGNPCASKLVMPTSFTAQNGATLHQQTNITVEGCKPTLKVLRHSAQSKNVTIVVRVPSAGVLSASGGGLTKANKRASKGRNITLHLALGKGARTLLKRHPGRKLMANVKLRFTPIHGSPISGSVAVLIG